MSAKCNAVLALLWAVAFSTACPAADPAGVPEVKRTTLGLYLTAEEAYEMVRIRPEAILFVDIRSVGEVQSAFGQRLVALGRIERDSHPVIVSTTTLQCKLWPGSVGSKLVVRFCST